MMRKYINLITIFSIFLMALYPWHFVPTQSDDYAYRLIGFNFHSIYDHYMGWSGRLVADVISILILNIGFSWLPKIIIPVVLAGMIFLIAALPYSRDNVSPIRRVNPLAILLIFFLYWVSNPSLGQTTFWVVGASNYLWTNLILVGFLFFYSVNLETKSSSRRLCLFIFGTIAGCTNENTAVFVVLICFISLFVKAVNKWNSTLSFSGTLIGFSLLILSPGNKVRALNFKYWYDSSLLERIDTHLFDRFPDAVSGYWLVYLALIIFLFSANGYGRDRLLGATFFLFSILANLILAASPVIPPRALNGGLIFALISLSFAIKCCQTEHNNKSITNAAFTTLITMSVIYFIPSYYLFSYMLREANYQSIIRNKIIDSSIKNNSQNIIIPDWFFTKTLKESDRFSYFHNEKMSDYFGVKRITPVKVDFDYGKLIKSKIMDVNQKISENIYLESIYFYKDLSTGFNNVVMELNQTNGYVIKSNECIIFIHIADKITGKVFNYDRQFSPVKIGEKLYIHIQLKKENEDVKRIETGLVDPKTKIRKSEVYLVL